MDEWMNFGQKEAGAPGVSPRRSCCRPARPSACGSPCAGPPRSPAGACSQRHAPSGPNAQSNTRPAPPPHHTSLPPSPSETRPLGHQRHAPSGPTLASSHHLITPPHTLQTTFSLYFPPDSTIRRSTEDEANLRLLEFMQSVPQVYPTARLLYSFVGWGFFFFFFLDF